MNSQPFDWKRFHAYRVFDEFLERFIINRRSFVTTHEDRLDFDAAFADIDKRFIEGANQSDKAFDQKVSLQFQDASEQTKIVFANVEYLWAMPMEKITSKKKRSYALRWFAGTDRVVRGERFFFDAPHNIADPGPWYLTNKYWEIVATLRVLSLVAKTSIPQSLDEVKRQIATICRKALYKGVPPNERFAPKNFCGIHPALMHLADPERYEAIISDTHRKLIIAVFGHIAEDLNSDKEAQLKQIRSRLYDSYGNYDDPIEKYRWFFYTKDVKPLWIGKKSAKEQRASSAAIDVKAELEAVDLEGSKEEATGYRIRRSAKLVKAAKKRDGHTCKACGFHFKDQIVHVHHLDPLSEYKHPRDTKLSDLVTLCPTCHYLAHYWLKENDLYKKLEPLLSKLGK